MDNKISVSLSKDLRKKYGIRSFPVATGDVVTIRTGSRKGEGGKVIKVNHRTKRVSIDGITISKADDKQEEFPLPSNILRITRLELSSPGRLQKIRELAARKNIVVEEVPEPEPEPEVAEEESEETAEESEAIESPDESEEETEEEPEVMESKPEEGAETEEESEEEEKQAEEEVDEE